MRIRCKTTILALVVPLVFALLAPTAFASTTGLASGTFNITIAPFASQSDDGNLIISFTLVETITGTASGTRVGAGTLVLHPDGTFSARDSGTFTGSIGGASGTDTLSIVATGVFGSSVQGRFRTSGGSGGLEDVNANGRFAGTAHAATSPLGFSGTYSGRVRQTGH